MAQHSTRVQGLAGIWQSLPSRRFTERRNYIWYVVGTVCIGAFMAALDASIVNVALPSMLSTFHTSYSAVEWVLIAYLLTLTALLTVFGRFADMIGRRPLYTFGFIVFIIGSATCGAAVNMPMLIISRVFQAAGAAMLQANSVAIITATVPPEVRGRAIGFQGSAQAVGLSVGPAVGGALIGLFGWRAIFYVNVPVGIIGTLMAASILPRDRHSGTQALFDWTGSLLFTPALVAVMLALSMGSEWGWGSARVLGLFAVAAVLLAFLVRVEKRHRAPLIDPRLFHRPVFTLGNVSGLLSYLAMFGVLFLMPFFFEHILGFVPAITGLLLTPVPLGMTVAAPFGGGFADRFGSVLPTVGGMGLTALGIAALMVSLSRHPSLPLLVVELLLVGLGLGLFTPANNSTVMGSAPKERLGVAGGILNMSRSLGMAMGTAVAGALLVAFLPAGGHVLATVGAVRAALVGLLVVALIGAGLSAMKSANTQSPGAQRKRDGGNDTEMGDVGLV